MRNIILLGSTGSIGLSTLDVIRAHRDRLSIVALAARANWKKLAEQIREFRPRLAVLFDGAGADQLREAAKGTDVSILTGMDGLREAVRLTPGDTLVSALVGSVGLVPVVEAIEAGKTICLANKETLVVGGRIVRESAARRGVDIIPIDSEHSAIFQCLGDIDRTQVRRLILTASGGPFRRHDREALSRVTPKEALKHPNWEMGGKITIDSATLMNKGLEVIEARWLFGIGFDRIEVVVHPQSIIHSMVEFVDGSIMAQMGAPDMRLPIQYALSHPHRWEASGTRIDLMKTCSLTFEQPRFDDFPCLNFAFEAGRKGGTLPCVMNAANEIAVEAFLRGVIPFPGIPGTIRHCMDSMPFSSDPDLRNLLECDAATRTMALAQVGGK